MYSKVNITSGTGDGQVGPGFGPAGGFVLGQTTKSGRWGGELRYIFFQNDIKLEGGSQSVDFGARSHSAAYDVLYYFDNEPDAKVLEFEVRFASEEACRDYLSALRWPEGFRGMLRCLRLA